MGEGTQLESRGRGNMPQKGKKKILSAGGGGNPRWCGWPKLKGGKKKESPGPRGQDSFQWGVLVIKKRIFSSERTRGIPRAGYFNTKKASAPRPDPVMKYRRNPVSLGSRGRSGMI